MRRLWMRRRWSLQLRLRLSLSLSLRPLLVLGRTWLAGFILAAAPAAPMSLRLPLTVVRCKPQLWLRLRRFCRHAFTSWCFAIEYVELEPGHAAMRCGRPSFPLPGEHRTSQTVFPESTHTRIKSYLNQFVSKTSHVHDKRLRGH
jgi:hypothetical protein